MSLRQQLIPEALFGRVQGAWRMVVYGAMPLGALLGGLVASRFGLTAPFLVAGLGHAPGAPGGLVAPAPGRPRGGGDPTPG